MSFLFVLCALFSCTSNTSNPLEENLDNIDLSQRGEDPGTDLNCCDFEYDVTVSQEGDCCVYSVSIWVNYVNCPITVSGPNGNVQSGAKSYFYFEYNSCENPGLEQANFNISYSDPVSQTSFICKTISLDSNC